MSVDRELDGLTLMDLSDREFLLVVRDAGGVLPFYVTAVDIAAHLNLKGENPGRSVSSRLAWMKRYGAVEREYARDSSGNLLTNSKGKEIPLQGWALSDLGFQMAIGKMTKATEKTISKLESSQMLLVMRLMAQRVAEGDGTVSKLMDREYRYGVGRR